MGALANSIIGPLNTEIFAASRDDWHVLNSLYSLGRSPRFTIYTPQNWFLVGMLDALVYAYRVGLVSTSQAATLGILYDGEGGKMFIYDD